MPPRLASVLLIALPVLGIGCNERPATVPAEAAAQPEVGDQAPSPSASPTVSPAPKHGDRRTNSLGMELVYIGPGEFMMGSPEDERDRHGDEALHKVVLSRGFWMSEAEVTQAQWLEAVGYINSRFRGPERPVDSVCWDEAKHFCAWLSEKEGCAYRLPTEAEWEYACRAGTTTPFGLGETISAEDANIDGTKPYGDAPMGELRNMTLPVKSFPPNAWGLYDMHGNAWELCEDWYGEDYYANSPESDPQGPATGERHVVRGGSWRGAARLARSAHRHRAPADYRHFYFGFRVVMEP